MQKINKYSFYGFAAVFLWSMTVAVARSLSENIGSRTAGASVYISGGLLLLAFSVIQKKNPLNAVRKYSKKYIFSCGSLFILYTLSLFVALGQAINRQQALEIGLVNYLWPSLTIILSIFILSKRASLMLLPATVVSFAGVILVLTQNALLSWKTLVENVSGNPFAYGLGFVAAVTWSLYSTLSCKWGDSEEQSIVPLFLLITGLFFLISIFIFPEPGNWTFQVIAEVILLGLATAFGYLFWDIAMRRGNIVIVVLSSYLTPFFSTLIGCIYLSVMPGTKLWFGCVLIITGAIISWRSIRD
ncbi:aromatic amino acid DMT transporter YddG [bacterium]|nr:aromatic amino acid DMT transporter YddG [bacterium]